MVGQVGPAVHTAVSAVAVVQIGLECLGLCESDHLARSRQGLRTYSGGEKYLLYCFTDLSLCIFFFLSPSACRLCVLSLSVPCLSVRGSGDMYFRVNRGEDSTGTRMMLC